MTDSRCGVPCRARTHLLWTAVFVMAAGAGVAGDYASGYQNITMSVPTRHFDWLDQSTDPKVEALFLCQREWGRDIVELVQRWPITYQVTTWTWKRKDWSAREVTANFIAPCHLYDTLAGTYLGFTDHATFEVEGGGPVALFARMPYEVTGLAASASERAGRRGQPLRIDLVVERAGEGRLGRHVIRCEVRTSLLADEPQRVQVALDHHEPQADRLPS